MGALVANVSDLLVDFVPVNVFNWAAVFNRDIADALRRCFRISPTNDVRLMTKAATEAVNRLFRPGFKYSKAEVLLLDLRRRGEFTEDLFSHSQPVPADRVMGVLDEIDGRWGRGTLRVASVPSAPGWAMRRDFMSQSFTTRLDQLWVVKAR